MTGRTLAAVRAEQEAMLSTRPAATDRQRQRHQLAIALFAEPPASTLELGDGDVGYRLELPPWFRQRAPKGGGELRAARGGRVKQVTWRPTWEPLSQNWSGPKQRTWEAKATVRGWVAMKAGPKGCALPFAEHLTVRVHYRPPEPGSRDGGNLAPLSKACLDGLVRGPQKYRTDRQSGARIELAGCDLVPDDTSVWVDERTPAILDCAGAAAAGLWLDVVARNPLGVLA